MSEHSDDFENIERDPKVDIADARTVHAEVQHYKYKDGPPRKYKIEMNRPRSLVKSAVTEVGGGDFEAGMAIIQQKRPSLVGRIQVVLGLASVLAIAAIVYENHDQIQAALAGQPAEPTPVAATAQPKIQ